MRLKIPPHLAYVATLPCETLMSAKQAVKIWQNYGHESVSPFFGPLCTLFACLYRLLSHLSFFSLFPYLLIFSFEIDPLCFQAGCRKRRPNLALVFVCLFCVVVHFFWLEKCMRAFVVLGLVFSTPGREIGLGKRLRNDPICARVGRKTTTQSTVNEPTRPEYG